MCPMKQCSAWGIIVLSLSRRLESALIHRVRARHVILGGAVTRGLGSHSVWQAVVGAVISSEMAVQRFVMASNDIGDSGAAALGRLLHDRPGGYRCALASLDVRNNMIGPTGCKVIDNVPCLMLPARPGPRPVANPRKMRS